MMGDKLTTGDCIIIIVAFMVVYFLGVETGKLSIVYQQENQSEIVQ